MRLKSIKLAGFKSFVDPTHINFPSNLCGVVGPNGCGKSNVIDAVRWVMGESSAKQLRGDSMMDVIFNGSNDRKPIGQASIELIFDNSSGRITGEYAAFNEISVKRRVQRDGANDYFLNSSKCRRRDITDIFLGTGLGPRSYSIIEQGMISNLITAKPEDLRIYIEEAAGISKYKERRRDTENRIRRTRENLERLTDIRDELARQLQKLQRQSKAAEKYRRLKTQQREITQQVLALRWQHFAIQSEQENKKLLDQQVELEKRQSKDTQNETSLEKMRIAFNEKNQQLNQIQGEYYNVGAETSRIEQSIQHNQQRQKQLQTELQQTQQNEEQLTQGIKQDQQKIKGWQAEIKQLGRQLEQSGQQQEQQQQQQQSAEQAMQTWQKGWDEFFAKLSDSQQQAEIQKSQIAHLEQLIRRLNERLERFDQQLQGLSSDEGNQAIADNITASKQQQQQLTKTIEICRADIEKMDTDIASYRQKLAQQQLALNQTRVMVQENKGQLASLQALQDSLNNADKKVQQWLQQQNLNDRQLLYSQLDVEPGCEKAVETVLNDSLKGVCVDQIQPHAESLNQLNGSLLLIDKEVLIDKEGLIDPQTDTTRLASKSMPTLAALSDKVNGAFVPAVIASVYVADDLPQALAQRDKLSAHESIVTMDGTWLGLNWMRVNSNESAESGVIERQKSITRLLKGLQKHQDSEQKQQSEYETNTQAVQQLEQALLGQRQKMEEAVGQLAKQQSQCAAQESQLEQWRYKNQQLNEEKQETQKQLLQEQEKLNSARQQVSQVIDVMDELNQEKQQWLDQKQQLSEALQSSRQQYQQTSQAYNQLNLRERTVQTQLAAVIEANQRLEEQQQRNQQRLQGLQQQLANDVSPITQLQKQLDEKLETRLGIEQRLNESRKQVEETQQSIRQLEQLRQQLQESLQQQRERIQQVQLSMQEVATRQSGLLEQLQGAEPTEILAAMPEEANLDTWQQQLDKIDLRIQQLGAVNLAAIDEYESEQERKQYLDEQNAELVEALETLESAMRKIDRETRTRFKETFEQINTGVQALFPRLFGGGHAYLELTGDDLLSTGVSIMARPPGKRNTTIHLLSGGEKALTAIALVFAIFQLNPAPFCLLDEVDAPLDDANVGRFASMVKEMSKTVQFIFISHNKVTMEMANQLMGVTMQEAGVSRIVTVDIDDAIEMVG